PRILPFPEGSPGLVRRSPDGLPGPDFYTFFYTSGWDALGRTGPRRHARAGRACSEASGASTIGPCGRIVHGAALCPLRRRGSALGCCVASLSDRFEGERRCEEAAR